MDEFCRDLSHHNVVKVYGHNAGESITSVMKALLLVIKSDIKIAKTSMKESAKVIANILKKGDEEYYLVIHNLDSTGFRFVLTSLSLFGILATRLFWMFSRFC